MVIPTEAGLVDEASNIDNSAYKGTLITSYVWLFIQ
jgi:hypothetical protein